jgi:hypothetical protein
MSSFRAVTQGKFSVLQEDQEGSKPMSKLGESIDTDGLS